MAVSATVVPAPEVELLLGCARRRVDPGIGAKGSDEIVSQMGEITDEGHLVVRS